MAKGKYNKAITNYLIAEKLNPEDEDVHYNLALVLAKQGDRNATDPVPRGLAYLPRLRR